jgi:hypothetical protein
MPKVEFKFEREPCYEQIYNRNRASTDALGVIVNWADPDMERSYDVHIDEDEFVIASLSYGAGDTDAENELIQRCRRVHVVAREQDRLNK